MRPLWWVATLLFCWAAPCAASPEAPALPGPTLTIEAVKIQGVRLGRQLMLSARVPLSKGDPLDEARIEDARLSLLSTGLFQTVEARLEKGSQRGRVTVIFDCVERPTTSLDAIHLGHARPTDLWAGLEVSDLDPVGLGVSLGAGVVGSAEQQAVQLRAAYGDLAGLGVDLSLSALGLSGQEPFVGPSDQLIDGQSVLQIPTDYSRKGLMPTASMWISDVRLAVGARFERVSAQLPEGAEEVALDGSKRAFEFHLQDGDADLFSLHLSGQRDTRDDPAFPTRGSRTSLLLRGGQYGEADPYYTALLGFEWYHRLSLGHVIRLDFKAGGVTAGAPFFDRFFIGDLHAYIPDRVLGLNFARRRGPNLIDGTIAGQRYEQVAGRIGTEYRIPIGRQNTDYRLEWFLATAFVSLGSFDEVRHSDPNDLDPFPYDLTLDTGLRLESEYGVVGISVGNLLLLVDPR